MHGRDCPKYVILGAGITGLSLAWFLKKQFPDCQLLILEKASKAGGWMQTHQTFGYLFEMGPHTLRLTDPHAQTCHELFKDLDLEDEIIHPQSSFNNRFLAYDGKLHPVKFSLAKLCHSKNLIKLTYPILRNTFKRAHLFEEDVSIEEFFNKNFGPFITEQLINPLVRGIHGGDIQHLSMQACFPQVHAACYQKKPLLQSFFHHRKNASSHYVSFKKGLHTLIEMLTQKLSDYLRLNTEVLKIKTGSKIQLETTHGELQCDHIFSTLPSHELAKLLPLDQLKHSHLLTEQKHISYKIVHLGYDAKLDLPNAFGFISPSWSDQQISGAIFDSKLFSQHNFHDHQTRITAMIHETSNLFNLPKNAFNEAFFEELNSLLNIHIDPQYYEVFHLPNAIAQYSVGHLKKVKSFVNELSEKIPSLTICGSSFYGVSVPACIEQAKESVTHFAKSNPLAAVIH